MSAGTGTPSDRPADPKDLDTLLDDIRDFVRRFVVVTPEQATVLALWVVHTYTIGAAETTPYLSINAATKQAGKTRLLEVLAQLVSRPWMTAGATEAVLFRRIEAEKPTLLLDESDAAFRQSSEYTEALRSLLNAGYHLGGQVSRCVGQGKNIKYRNFSVFCPKALAGISTLPDTVADRSISITLKRRRRDEHIERFRLRHEAKEAKPLKERLEQWAKKHIPVLDGKLPDLPDELSDRAQDVWEPLLAIADLAENAWPQQARQAAVTLSGQTAMEDSDDLGVTLLADIQRVFPLDEDRISSKDLLEELLKLEDAPWLTWRRGQALTQNGVARLLKPFGIRPTKLRIEGDTPRGYCRDDFADAWSRYLPSEVEQVEQTNKTAGETGVLHVEQTTSCSDPKPPV